MIWVCDLSVKVLSCALEKAQSSKEGNGSSFHVEAYQSLLLDVSGGRCVY